LPEVTWAPAGTVVRMTRMSRIADFMVTLYAFGDEKAKAAIQTQTTVTIKCKKQSDFRRISNVYFLKFCESKQATSGDRA
jgi:hypothetical protein